MRVFASTEFRGGDRAMRGEGGTGYFKLGLSTDLVVNAGSDFSRLAQYVPNDDTSDSDSSFWGDNYTPTG